MAALAVVIYLLLCLFLAILGRHSKLGFSTIFVLSVIITPLVVAIFLNISRQISLKLESRREAKDKAKTA